MPNCLVSLIIPVYNVEKYLKKCLDSAITQTLTEIEIIVVNDGSTDGSLSIINAYASRDQRIKVVSQENCGLGAARNAGIRIAQGEYLAFMDSDDWVEPDFLEKMYVTACYRNVDIVICNHVKTYEELWEFKNGRHLKADVYTGHEAMKKIISDSVIQSFAWDKLYKRTLFTLNDIYYPKSLYFEDMATTFKVFYYAKTVGVIDDCLYHYLQRKGSISRKMSPRRVFDNITVIAMMREFLENKGIFERYIHEYQYLCFKMLMCVYFNLPVIYIHNGKPGLLKSLKRASRELISLAEEKQHIKHMKKEESGVPVGPVK